MAASNDPADEQRVRRDAEIAAKQTWSNFEELGDRLEELALMYDDEDAMEAWQTIEGVVTDLDDVLYEAQQAAQKEEIDDG